MKVSNIGIEFLLKMMKLSYWFLLCSLNKSENLVWELDCIKITGISKT